MKNSPKNPDFSLILPCYNESKHITSNVAEIINVLENSNYKFEIILIDDKSLDNTIDFIKKLAKKFNQIKYFFHQKNLGRGATVMDGIRRAKGDIVGFIDIDLEVAPQYIPYLVSIIKLGKADIVVGRRFYPFILFPLNHVLRVLSSKIYSKLIKFTLNLPIEDTESGYKFFNRNKILPILPSVIDKHWFWDTEIIARSLIAKLKVKEVPVLFLRNRDKTSTVKLLPDTVKYLKALYLFKRNLKK